LFHAADAPGVSPYRVFPSPLAPPSSSPGSSPLGVLPAPILPSRSQVSGPGRTPRGFRSAKSPCPRTGVLHPVRGRYPRGLCRGRPPVPSVSAVSEWVWPRLTLPAQKASPLHSQRLSHAPRLPSLKPCPLRRFQQPRRLVSRGSLSSAVAAHRLSWGLAPSVTADRCPFRGPPRCRPWLAASCAPWPPPVRFLPAPARFSRASGSLQGLPLSPGSTRLSAGDPLSAFLPSITEVLSGPRPQGLVLGESPLPPTCKQDVGPIPSWAQSPSRLQRPGLAPRLRVASAHDLTEVPLPDCSGSSASAGLQRLPAWPPDLLALARWPTAMVFLAVRSRAGSRQRWPGCGLSGSRSREARRDTVRGLRRLPDTPSPVLPSRVFPSC